MLTEECTAFREGFEAGRESPHRDACPECGSWAAAVTGLRDFGADLPLSSGLRARLAHIPRGGAGEDRGHSEAGRAFSRLAPLPQLPLPKELRGRLRRIPAEMGIGAPPLWTVKTRDLLAASCLLAFLLAPAVNRHVLAGESALSIFARGFGMVLGEAGSRGGQALLDIGDVIFRGCERANDSMGGLLGRLSPPRPKPTEPQRQPGNDKGSPDRNSPTGGKENRHGNRPAHRE